jgi:hypothetical protein
MTSATVVVIEAASFSKWGNSNYSNTIETKYLSQKNLMGVFYKKGREVGITRLGHLERKNGPISYPK